MKRTKSSTNYRTTYVIKAAAGEEALYLARLLDGNRQISEFSLVRRMKLDIQKVRNLLYRLHSSNLAGYKRIKDTKKGVYVSYWSLNHGAIRDFFKRLKKERLQTFKERLQAETNSQNAFFVCPSACIRADFALATHSGFRCSECGQLLQTENNAGTIHSLKAKIRKMEIAESNVNSRGFHD